MDVRWDAVVDRSLMTGEAVSAPTPPPSSKPVGSFRAHVELFGALIAAAARRSIDLEVPAGARVHDLLILLSRELGDAFLARVLDAAGKKQRYCRLFVDGIAVEDMQQPLAPAADPARIEIILLMGLEGG